MKSKILLIFVLIFSFFLRIYKINNLELFGDELDVGYQAYSLWTTGSDYMGNKFPVYIHSFSEWRAPLLMYVTAPFVGILGLNSLAVRLPPVIFGVLNVLLIYILVKMIFKKERLALVSSLVLALLPWHIHYSRAAFEVTLLSFLILLGTIFFLQGLDDKKRYYWGAVCFALSFYTYNVANVFVPLWILSLFFLQRKELTKKGLSSFVFPGLLAVILVLPLGLSILRGQGAARFNLISIFNNPQTIDEIVFKRNSGLESQRLERVFHNKVTGWGKEFFSNYLTSFSPQFLFLEGDPNLRHSLKGFGQISLVALPFILIGIWQLVKSKKSTEKIFLIWLLLAPLASSLTVGGGNQATRLFLMIFPLVIFAGLGLDKLLRKWSLLITFLLFGFTTMFWTHEYFVHYPKEAYKWWHYGYEESFNWLKGNEGKYDRIFINNSHEPGLIRYLFWTKKDVSQFRSDFSSDEVKENMLPNFNGFSLGKVFFGNIAIENKLSWLEENLDSQSIYLAFQLDEVPGDWSWEEEPPAGFKILKTVYDPLGKPMVYWVTKINENN